MTCGTETGQWSLQDVDKVRRWAVEQMCGVAAIKSAPAAIKSEVLKFLAIHAFFAVDKDAYSKVRRKRLKASRLQLVICTTPLLLPAIQTLAGGLLWHCLSSARASVRHRYTPLCESSVICVVECATVAKAASVDAGQAKGAQARIPNRCCSSIRDPPNVCCAPDFTH